MGDMSSGGAPRVKSIVEKLDEVANCSAGSAADLEAIRTATEATQAAVEGTVETDIATIGGTTPTLGQGDADGGTLRVAIATNDTNLSAINSAVGTLAKENGGNLEDIKTAIAGTLEGDGTLRVTVADDDTNLSAIKDDVGSILAQVDNKTSTLAKESGGNLAAIKVATEAAIARDALDQVTDTGSDPMQAVYAPAPAGAFRLEYVTVHLSAVPTTPGDIVIRLISNAGSAFDVALFRVDPSDDQGVTDICYIPDRPIPCMPGDSVSVTYVNDDALTYGARIVVRGE